MPIHPDTVIRKPYRQRSIFIQMTGLSGAGKSTIAEGGASSVGSDEHFL